MNIDQLDYDTRDDITRAVLVDHMKGLIEDYYNCGAEEQEEDELMIIRMFNVYKYFTAPPERDFHPTDYWVEVHRNKPSPL